jgi:hypothetical protein
MALKAVLIGPRGTVFKDGNAQTGILNDLVLFIRRMHAKGVHVGLWSQHPVSYRHSIERIMERSRRVPAQGRSILF